MSGKRFCSASVEDASPMNMSTFFEGLSSPPFSNAGFVGFDIETFSPDGFPDRAQDPIVNFSFSIPISRSSRTGLLTVSLICDPDLEKDLLVVLHSLLVALRGAYLLTYNGTKFDVNYVIERGNSFGLEFDKPFSDLSHIDLFKFVKCLNLGLPSLAQKTVECALGIDRVVKDVSGASYHLAFNGFLAHGALKPIFYNIEDSAGCLRIADRVFCRRETSSQSKTFKFNTQ